MSCSVGCKYFFTNQHSSYFFNALYLPSYLIFFLNKICLTNKINLNFKIKAFFIAFSNGCFHITKIYSEFKNCKIYIHGHWSGAISSHLSCGVLPVAHITTNLADRFYFTLFTAVSISMTFLVLSVKHSILSPFDWLK